MAITTTAFASFLGYCVYYEKGKNNSITGIFWRFLTGLRNGFNKAFSNQSAPPPPAPKQSKENTASPAPKQSINKEISKKLHYKCLNDVAPLDSYELTERLAELQEDLHTYSTYLYQLVKSHRKEELKICLEEIKQRILFFRNIKEKGRGNYFIITSTFISQFMALNAILKTIESPPLEIHDISTLFVELFPNREKDIDTALNTASNIAWNIENEQEFNWLDLYKIEAEQDNTKEKIKSHWQDLFKST